MIILVHALMRTHRSMYRLGRYLKKHGYEIYLYRYPSTKYKIAEHSTQLKLFIEDLLSKYPDKKLSFVTHSLGGIITREALSLLSEKHLSQCDRLIMLAPPSKGSYYPKLLLKFFPFLSHIIKPLAELSCDPESYVHKVSTPEKLKIGIIVGKYDSITPPSSTKLKEQSDFIVINATHAFIMNNANARKAILQFLKNARFTRS